MLGSKKRDEVEVFDTISGISDNRSNGNDAELFSAPVGFIPRFPLPPKYIKVKVQNRRSKDFDRLFLAQILLDTEKKSRLRRASIDSKIHGIDENPQATLAASLSSNKAIWAVEFSKDGRYMAAAGQDKKLRVWEILSNPEDREAEEREASNGEDEGNVRLNAPVFKQKLIREYDGHTSSILDLSWSKNNFLLSSSMDKTVRLYHVSRVECLCAFKHNDFVTSIQFHPRDDRFFLAGSLDSKIRLWSIPDKSVAYCQQVADMVTAVAFTPDGKTSIAGCLNGLCVLYDTEGLKAHSQIHVKSARGKNSKGSKVTGIDTIAIPRENGPPDVKLLITSNDSRIRMYNLKDRNLEIKFRGNENSCSQIHATFSDDGKFVICGSEDRKVYIWPTGPLERPDSDKRPVEVFEAHSSIVTSALMVSTRSRKLLAQSGDPLYDLCNPPPVTLISRAESIVSSKAPTSTGSDEQRVNESNSPPKRAPETPAYLARSAHPGGYILVTADYSGQIKVFRQDCAYYKRRQESFDGSTKRMLARSGSVATRNSVGSSIHHRGSLNLGNKNHSADRILSWRNSISGTSIASVAASSNSHSDINLRGGVGLGTSEQRTRSNSPSSRWRHRLSLRGTSNSHSNAAKTAAAAATPPLNTASSPITSPSSPYSNPKSPPNPAGMSIPQLSVTSPTSPAITTCSPNTKLRKLPSNPTANDLPRSPGDELFLAEGHSLLAWNVENTIMSMVRREPRTPGVGLGRDRNPMDELSRRSSRASAGTRVSDLSSELEGEGEESGSGSVGEEGGGGGTGNRIGDAKGNGDEYDVVCPNCGGRTFRATVGEVGKGHRLRCRTCGTVI